MPQRPMSPPLSQDSALRFLGILSCGCIFYQPVHPSTRGRWGDSFHFGFRTHSEPHAKAIANSQNFLAQKLHVSDMQRVLDLG